MIPKAIFKTKVDLLSFLSDKLQYNDFKRTVKTGYSVRLKSLYWTILKFCHNIFNMVGKLRWGHLTLILKYFFFVFVKLTVVC